MAAIDFSTTDLDSPSYMRGDTDSDDEIRRKIIKIKKERLQALSAFAKSQTILAEIDLAIAEYELKLEINKLRQQKFEHGSRRTKNQKVSKKTLTSKTRSLGSQQNSPKNKTYHENSRNNLSLKRHDNVFQMKDASINQWLQSRKFGSLNKEMSKNVPKTDSIKCSIPFYKIINLQNISQLQEHILSTHREHNSEKENMSRNSSTDACNNLNYCTSNNQSVSNQNVNICNENMPVDSNRIQHEVHSIDTKSTGNVPANTVRPRKRICISMLTVTHRYNFSIIPCVIQNQSEFAYIQSDHIGNQEQLAKCEQMVTMNSNRLLNIYNNSEHSEDDFDQIKRLDMELAGSKFQNPMLM